MICTAKHPNDYHLLTRPKMNVKIYDCQCNVVANIEGNLSLDLIEDIYSKEGPQAAKDAWWETYLWIKEQEAIQYKEKDIPWPKPLDPPTTTDEAEARQRRFEDNIRYIQG